jgi:methylthioribose-1-phosphate isomerase
MDFAKYDHVRPIQFAQHTLRLLDQRHLPMHCDYLAYDDAAGVAKAIKQLVVRGAPAIGIAAAYAIALAAKQHANLSASDFLTAMQADFALLRAARPTAVNLAWALTQMRGVLAQKPADAYTWALARASELEAADLAANHQMGELGAALLPSNCGVLTHCNTGSLATAGFGTALGVIRAGVALGKINAVFASETRPWLQGARLTAWELKQDGIDAKLIADGAGAFLLSGGRVHWFIVGADRICANGDTANKIGTLHHAIAAKYFGVRVMVVAPWSTVDLATKDGRDIHIEERHSDELLEYAGQRIAALGVQAWNPVFDVTAGSLIDAIVTERGVALPPFQDSLQTLATKA